MANFIKIVFSTCFLCVAPLIFAKNRTVALKNDQRTGTVNILLAAKKGVWQDFDAITAETNGLVCVSRQLYPSVTDPRSGDTFNFCEVNYVSGADLYQKGRAQGIEDYIWVPLSQIQGQKQAIVTTSRGIKRYVDGLLLWALRNINTTTQISPNSSGQQSSTWLSIPGSILFYNAGQPYYQFTNFWDKNPITIDNIIWPTTEHYFQAQKFAGNKQMQLKISAMQTPRDVFQFMRNQPVPGDWHTHGKFIAMRTALDAKFNQHVDLQKLLLSTGNAVLVENAGANDAEWGAGADGSGKNYLGRMLMVVRQSIKDNYYFPFDPQSTLTFDHLQRNNFNPECALKGAVATTTAVTSYTPQQLVQQYQPLQLINSPSMVSMNTNPAGAFWSARPQTSVGHMAYGFYRFEDDKIVLSLRPDGSFGAHQELCNCNSQCRHRVWIPFDYNRMDRSRHKIFTLNSLKKAVEQVRLSNIQAVQNSLCKVYTQDINNEFIELDVKFIQVLKQPGELERFLGEAS